MGQYYKLVCAETCTYLEPHALGAGLKAIEQIYSRGPGAALAFLCAAGTGDHPRDLPWTPKGAWAGRTPLMLGDYAAAGDLRGRVSALSLPEQDYYDALYASNANSTTLGQGGRASKKPKSFTKAFLPIYERALGTRATDLDIDGVEDSDAGWRDFVDVALTPQGWDVNLAGYSKKEADEYLDYLERARHNRDPKWKRGPIAIEGNAPDSVPGPEAGHGTPLLWVNLDREEFFDPAVIGDVPDLVGVMVGKSVKAVQAMILHAVVRGGGDLRPIGPFCATGRWRGDRIALIGTGGLKTGPKQTLTPDEVRATFRDITGSAASMAHDEDFFGVEDAIFRGADAIEGTQAKTELGAIEKQLVGAALMDPFVAAIAKDTDEARRLRFVIVPPHKMKRTGASKVPTAALPLAPRFDVLYADPEHGPQKICLETQTYRNIAAIFEQTKPVAIKVKIQEKKHLHVDVSEMTEFSCEGLSQHALVALMSKAPAHAE